MSQGLTICSVSFRSRSCLDLNWRLTEALNRKEEPSWLVAENTEEGHPESLDGGDGRFRVVRGVPCLRTSPYRGAYHHALTLNYLTTLVRTRYVLYLDPDFFIVRPEWIREVLGHMRARRLSFFGAPYYPARAVKYRYFPCGICMVVDLERVPRERLDFTPEQDEVAAASGLPWAEASSWALLAAALSGRLPAGWTAPPGITPEIVRHVARRRVVGTWMQRLPGWPLIQGQACDTGCRVYRYFGPRRRYARECLTPAWDNPMYSRPGAFPPGIKGWLLRRLLPDFLCRFPKQRRYASANFFRDFGLPDLHGLGWEENLWRGEPFGFHVGGLFQGLKQVGVEDLEQLLARFFDHGRPEPSASGPCQEGVRK